jgi:hypothetical protein
MSSSSNGIFTQEDAKAHIHSPKLAQAISQILDDDDDPVVDMGCGNGYYLSVLSYKRPARSLLGIEGYIPKDTFHESIVTLDLTKRLIVPNKGHVISLEVGEHIPEECEDQFIDNITRNCQKYLILSWAIPGQPGIGHVNCKSNDYIIQKIEEKGFTHLPGVSNFLRKEADDTTPWFRNTLMVFHRINDDDKNRYNQHTYKE